MAGQTDPHISLFSPQEVLLLLIICMRFILHVRSANDIID